MEETQYVDFVRSRITQLRLQRNISEHKMSLDLDKSGSYIRSITNGTALPSLKELFHMHLIISTHCFFAFDTVQAAK